MRGYEMRVREEAQRVCSLDEMGDGDVAVIETWPSTTEYNGLVVQRYKDILILLGSKSGKSWPNIFDRAHGDGLLVRILPKGTLIEI
jgi:hypothetical protein